MCAVGLSFILGLSLVIDISAGADIAWIRGITKLPLVIKGIQCVEDAEKAYEHGVEGIVLSNHGGRELDLYVYSYVAWLI